MDDVAAHQLAEELTASLGAVSTRYHRLVLLVAPSGAGKTAALQSLHRHAGAPLINVNLELSRRLLGLSVQQRAQQAERVLDELICRQHPLVLLDNTEVLFDVGLQQDPLRLLQRLSRNRTVVAAWNGSVNQGQLVYAAPGHPEHRRYATRDLVVVSPEIHAQG